MHDQLRTVANAQNGDADAEQSFVQTGGIFRKDTFGTTGQNNSNGRKVPDLFGGHGIGRVNLTKYMAFPDPTSDQLGVGTAKIQNKDLLHG
jgi:hypothetical protein